MKPGHCFTIEPMINEGGWRDEQWPDHWTAVTADGSRSAQVNMLLIIINQRIFFKRKIILICQLNPSIACVKSNLTFYLSNSLYCNRHLIPY